MKKIFALALAIVMMMAIALPVFAADDLEEKNDTTPLAGEAESSKYGSFDDSAADTATLGNNNLELKYGVYQTYIITIPADINFGYMAADGETYEAKRTVSASDVVINGKEFLVISVSSANTWQMVDKDGKSVNVDYSATLATPTLKNDDATVTFKNGTTTQEQQILVVDHAKGNEGYKSDVMGKDSVEITFNTAGTAQEGTYVDTLTFSVLVTEIDPITDRPTQG